MIFLHCMVYPLGPCTLTNLFNQTEVIIIQGHYWYEGQISPNGLQSYWFINVHLSCIVIKYFWLDLTWLEMNQIYGCVTILKWLTASQLKKHATNCHCNSDIFLLHKNAYLLYSCCTSLFIRRSFVSLLLHKLWGSHGVPPLSSWTCLKWNFGWSIYRQFILFGLKDWKRLP